MIKELTIHRFKCFSDKTFKFSPDSLSLIVGGNNSGKSTILHAFAVWEFCKLIVKIEKGDKTLLGDTPKPGLGLNADEFLPIAIPSLNHLWTNLRSQKKNESDGYTLRVKCKWDTSEQSNCELEFGLSLANDRLFIKVTKSNIKENTKIPNIAYLPTFAGITDKEGKHSFAERRRLIGKGMAGAIIRNQILDFYNKNQAKRLKLKGTQTKIRNEDLTDLRNNDAFELLQKALRDTFSSELKVIPFNDLYHTFIKIETYKGEYKNKRFSKFNNFNSRDIMVEGSGFLQWLNVYTLTLNEELDFLLLDEPDAHLHTSLQTSLIERLIELVKNKKKQVFIATHSSEIIRNFDAKNIYSVDKLDYLSTDSQKISVLAGLGTDYAPKINALVKWKHILFVENEIDSEILKIFIKKLELNWPANLVIWNSSSGHKERKHLYLELKKEINGLKAISLRDRDDEPYNTVDDELVDKSHSSDDINIKCLKWKRKELENYLLLPTAIARTASVDLDIINEHFRVFGLAIPDNFKDSNVPSAIYDCNAKEIIYEFDNSFCKKFSIDRYEIAKNFERIEICDDIVIFLNTLIRFCE